MLLWSADRWSVTSSFRRSTSIRRAQLELPEIGATWSFTRSASVREIGACVVREGLRQCRERGAAARRWRGIRNEYHANEHFMVLELVPGSLSSFRGLAKYLAEFAEAGDRAKSHEVKRKFSQQGLSWRNNKARTNFAKFRQIDVASTSRSSNTTNSGTAVEKQTEYDLLVYCPREAGPHGQDGLELSHLLFCNFSSGLAEASASCSRFR